MLDFHGFYIATFDYRRLHQALPCLSTQLNESRPLAEISDFSWGNPDVICQLLEHFLNRMVKAG